MYGGFISKIDKLGRTVIPKQLRQELGVDYEGAGIELFFDGKQIVLKKAAAKCTFCLSEAELKEFEGKHICAACISKLKSE